MTKVKEAIAITFAYYNPGKVLDMPILELYASDLSDLDQSAVCGAYVSYRRNPKNRYFPLPAQIREIVNPQDYISAEDQAAEIAARICGAVSTCGWNNARAAAHLIGPTGWQVVQRQGGWSYICENLGLKINPSTFQAQIRNQLVGAIKYGDHAISEAIGVLPARREGGDLIPIGRAMKKLTGGDQ